MKMKQKLIYLCCIYMLMPSVFAADLQANLHWPEARSYSFAVNGLVDKVMVHEGQKLSKGDILATLDLRPFNSAVKQCRAEIKKLDPSVFDAKLELDQAEELFERTVLSEVELQKIDGVYKSLVAEREMAEAACDVVQWQAERAVLKAEKASYVLSSNIIPGLVVSDENKSLLNIQLVPANQAMAMAYIQAEKITNYKIGQSLKVEFDGNSIDGIVQSVALQPNAQGLHRLQVTFPYTLLIEPMKEITLKF